MKNNALIIGIVGIIVIAGAIIYANKNKATESENMMKNETASMDSKEDAMMKEETRYIPYSKNTFNNSADTKRVLFFYANWCPTCIPANADFEENSSKIPSDVTVIRVNYNDTETDVDEKALAKQYGITYQHTFVQIDETGQEVAKWNGGQIDELLANSK